MAETPSDESPILTQNPNPAGNDLDTNSLQFSCHHCEKRVLIESLADLPDVICEDCKNGFVESISAVGPDSPPLQSFRSTASEEIDDLFFGNHFLRVLRHMSQDSHEEDHPPPPSEHVDPTDDNYLRIELGAWDAADDEDEDSVEVRRDDEYENRDLTDNQEQESEAIGAGGDGEEERDTTRRQDDLLQVRLSAATRRNRVLDWAEILMGIEDHTVELRFLVPESDTFIGNPGDYVDAAGYETLLQNLVENDNGGRRGAPPASKEAVEGLENMLIGNEEFSLACSICKDSLNVGDMAKKLPCAHEYHGDCIIPWLRSRNSCPICRFELPTDDPEYEEERKKRAAEADLTAGSSITSSRAVAGAGAV